MKDRVNEEQGCAKVANESVVFQKRREPTVWNQVERCYNGPLTDKFRAR